MKKPSHSPTLHSPLSDQGPHPSRLEVDLKGIDRVVDDLSQQDVLPSELDPAPMLDEESPHTEGDHLVLPSVTLGDIQRWDEPPGSPGHQILPLPLEDEAAETADLVNQGVTEADDELRELDDALSPEEDGDHN